MRSAESMLKTQQVAKALGVSVSTVKRWVDSGSLVATRTLGKHRLVPVAEAIRFARSQNLSQAGFQDYLRPRHAILKDVDDSTREALFRALQEGQESESRSILAGAYAALGNAPQLADEVIRPVMERIGHGWATDELDVYQEHRASRILESSLTGLIANLPLELDTDDSPVALGATPEGDLYTISGLLSELTLREMGWDVANLGPNMPLSSFARAVRAYRPSLIWLSVNHLTDVDRFVQDYAHLYKAANDLGAAICLGGGALTPALRTRVLAASFGERIGHLAEFARRLRPTLQAKRDTLPDSDPRN